MTHEEFLQRARKAFTQDERNDIMLAWAREVAAEVEEDGKRRRMTAELSKALAMGLHESQRRRP